MTAPIAPQGEHPRDDHTLEVHADGREDAAREAGQHAAAEGHEHEVDEELAGETHEVHAPGAGAPPAGGVGDADSEPQRDRQVQAGQHLGVSARRERHAVDEDGGRRERQGQPQAGGPVEPALPGEVAGEQGQHEQTEVEEVEHGELFVGVQRRLPEQRGQLDGERRRKRQADDDDGLAAGAGRRRARRVRPRDELLPQPLGVLAGELARDRVELAQPLDRHQEGFVGGQTRVLERGHLVPQVAFQLLHVGRVDRLPPAQVLPPPGNLCFDRVVSYSHCSSRQRKCLPRAGPPIVAARPCGRVGSFAGAKLRRGDCRPPTPRVSLRLLRTRRRFYGAGTWPANRRLRLRSAPNQPWRSPRRSTTQAPGRRRPGPASATPPAAWRPPPATGAAARRGASGPPR